MINGVHIYTAAKQPATNFIDARLGKRGAMRFRFSPRHCFFCDKCLARRWAANLDVRVYYDALRFSCREDCSKGKRKAQR